MPLWMSDLKRLQTFTFVGKPKRESLILHAAHVASFGRVVLSGSYENHLLLWGVSEKKFDDLPPNVELMEGFPDNLSDMDRGHDHSLVVLDDLMSQCSNGQRVADLFTRGSHHRGISVLYLTQNLFLLGKLSRTISLNSHYLVIFRNPRNSLDISTLAKQMFPGRTDYLMESFRDATSRPYGYLVIDCHQLTPENMRLRTNILPGERQIAYVKRT